MAFLPDGGLLVTQKSGSIALLSRDGRRIEQSITGLLRVASQGPDGLLYLITDSGKLLQVKPLPATR